MSHAKILIVEDESVVAMELEERLLRLDYEVIGVVASANAVFEKIQVKRPDLVLMDIQIRGAKDGIETAREIRAQFNIPIIYLTAHADESTLQRAKSTEPYGYLVKPFRELELRATIETALHKRDTEQKLQESEVRFRALAETSPDVIYLIDLDGFKASYLNRPDLFGYTLEELQAHGSITYAIHPDDREAVLAHWQELMQGNINKPIEYRIKCKDGHWEWVLSRERFLTDSPGSPLGQLWVTLSVITERKQAEEQLRLSESRYRAMVEDQTELVCRMSPEGVMKYVNQSYLHFFGKTREEVIGTSIDGRDSEGQSAMMKTSFALLGSDHPIISFEEYLPLPDGAKRWVQWVNRAICDENGKLIEIQAVGRDITERKRAENALFRSERDLSEAQSIAQMGSWELELATNDFQWSGELGNIFSIPPDDAYVYNAVLDRIHPDDRDHTIQVTQQAIAMGNPYEVEYRILTSEGEVKHILTRGRVIFDGQGKPAKVRGTSQDITKRKNAEMALRESWTRFEGVVNNAFDAIVSIDKSQKIVLFNSGAERIFDWNAHDIIGKPLDLLLPSEVIASHQGHVNHYSSLRKDTARLMNAKREVHARRRDGTLFPVEVTISKIEIQGGQIHTAVLRDITERKQAEAALIAKNRELEALFDISTHLRSARTVDEMLPSVIQDIQRNLGTEANAILLLSENGTHFICAIGTGAFVGNQRHHVDLNQGTYRHVIERQLPYIAERLTNELEPLSMGNFGPAILVPLHSESGVIGMLVAARENDSDVGAFSRSEIKLLMAIGEMFGNALRRAQLHDDALRRLKQMQALLNIDIAIASTLDAHQILHVLLIETLAQLEVDAADVLLLDCNTETLKYRAGRGFKTTLIEDASFHLDSDEYAGIVARECRTLVVQDLSQDVNFTRATLVHQEGFKSYICAPLITKGDLIGVLEVFRRTPISASKEWMSYLTSLATRAAISIENTNLFANLQNKNLELSQAYEATIEGWSRALELREQETERHTSRVMDMTIQLAKAMNVPEDEIIHIRRGALLHDIGKMGIPDSVLLKPAKLTDEEWKIMRMHPQHAYEMIRPIEYLTPAIDIPYCHHERWDGKGYPRGLKGEQIPLSARLFAVCDVWDAITNDRPYRKAWSKEQALQYIRSQAGIHFDPKVVEYFQELAGVKQ